MGSWGRVRGTGTGRRVGEGAAPERAEHNMAHLVRVRVSVRARVRVMAGVMVRVGVRGRGRGWG